MCNSGLVLWNFLPLCCFCSSQTPWIPCAVPWLGSELWKARFGMWLWANRGWWWLIFTPKTLWMLIMIHDKLGKASRGVRGDAECSVCESTGARPGFPPALHTQLTWAGHLGHFYFSSPSPSCLFCDPQGGWWWHKLEGAPSTFCCLGVRVHLGMGRGNFKRILCCHWTSKCSVPWGFGCLDSQLKMAMIESRVSIFLVFCVYSQM